MCTRIFSIWLPASILLLMTPVANATSVTFDDLPTGGLDTIPRPYYGLIFGGSPYNGVVNPSVSGLLGVKNGVVSAPNALLTDPQGLSIQPLNYEQGALFTFESGYFTAANQDELTVTAMGIRNGLDPLVKTFVISSSTPSFVTFNWTSLAEITFTGAFTGTNGDSRIVMDDLSVNSAPEPALDSIVAAALFGLFLWSRKRGSLRL